MFRIRVFNTARFTKSSIVKRKNRFPQRFFNVRFPTVLLRIFCAVKGEKKNLRISAFKARRQNDFSGIFTFFFFFDFHTEFDRCCSVFRKRIAKTPSAVLKHNAVCNSTTFSEVIITIHEHEDPLAFCILAYERGAKK